MRVAQTEEHVEYEETDHIPRDMTQNIQRTVEDNYSEKYRAKPVRPTHREIYEEARKMISKTTPERPQKVEKFERVETIEIEKVDKDEGLDYAKSL